MSNDEKAHRHGVGFWLLMAAIVVLLAAIAVPNFVKARTTSSQNACINNLRQIDGAKDQWAIEKGHKVGEPAVASEVFEYIKGGAPLCPSGGVYSLNPLGQNPTCSIGGAQHSLR